MEITSGQLGLVRAISESGSLARAAWVLGISAPAVSQQIARMEDEIGAAVVERGARGTRLTELGELLAAHAVRVGAALDETKDAVAGYLGEHSLRLRIGAFPSAAVNLLPEALTALRYRHPDVELSITELLSDSGPDQVASGELDIAITASYGQRLSCEPNVRLEHLCADPIRVVLPDDHRLADRSDDEAVAMSDLGQDVWACGVAGRPARSQLEAAAARSGVTVRKTFQTESYDVAQALTSSGVAVAFVPEIALVRAKRTRTRRLIPELDRDIYVALPSTTDHVALATELLTLLRKGERPVR
ncbi:DNA-binding transcriptional LysR family regulator [Tamaricihabitans halophyticus]|uniref:DNA-binding transcriptional LysR family regulator n=1 Tax=Tamaricihabitans halophyticus TaxID=1262583 RepID=A0A4R2PW54_9PSEU|nr:LysR family transcriptional regulator [Tamaricihabitans halophyticus]TCP39368.1 DNA-binding transcriptional LysR family regulator [Tamaricihabitans halophyticus]